MSNIIIPQKEGVEPWDKSSDRLLVYADFMGFKNRIYDKSHEELREELTGFRNKLLNKLSPLLIGDNLKIVQFSDSILLVVNGISYKMLNILSKAAICLMHTAMAMQIPLKGAMAQGLFTYDKENELYFGKPLVEAYLLHDEVKFYGILVHHSAERVVKQYNKSSKHPIFNSAVYIDKGKINHYHLCWNLVKTNLSAGDITKSCNNWLDKISENVSGAPRLYIDRTKEVLENDKKLFSPKNRDVEGAS